MVGGNFEIYFFEIAKNTLPLSTMVGENFEIYWSQMAKSAFKNLKLCAEAINDHRISN